MAVFTKLTDSEIREHLSQYNIGNILRIEGLAEGTENTNYKIHSTVGNYVFTIFEGRTVTKQLPTLFKAITLMRGENLPVPAFIITEENAIFPALGKKTTALQHFLSGEKTEFPSQSQGKGAGEMLALIHGCTEGVRLSIEDGMSLPVLEDMFEELKSYPKNVEETESFNALMEEISFQNGALPTTDLPQGIIHGDYFRNNVFFEEDSVSGVIDFYFACNEAYVYDLAIALADWGFRKGEFSPTHFHAFLEGYSTIRPLSKEEKEALPLLLRRAAMRFLLTRLYDAMKGEKEDIIQTLPLEPWLKRLQFFQTEGLNFS